MNPSWDAERPAWVRSVVGRVPVADDGLSEGLEQYSDSVFVQTDLPKGDLGSWTDACGFVATSSANGVRHGGRVEKGGGMCWSYRSSSGTILEP